jgi:CDP-paratose 2-epimerase
MGRVDQGVFALWALHHHYDLPLSYIGFGGTGRQVRDLLHVEDLVDLIDLQLTEPEAWTGETLNVGGGPGCSLSLLETTELCRELSGNEVPIDAVPETRFGDVPVYLSDCRALHARSAWRPRRDARTVIADILGWIERHADEVGPALGIPA